MVRERCLKKSFQDSLENIKERMMEKRSKKLAKVATVKQKMSTAVKTKILNNSAVMMKNFQANNRALAQALEEEKIKMSRAQDVILHLKREYQALMFQTFLLRRKLNNQQSAESKLASLGEIIGKVTHSLLETANLLGPAHDLCATNFNTRLDRPSTEERGSNVAASEILVNPKAMTITEKVGPPTTEPQQASEKSNVKRRISKGLGRDVRRSSLPDVPEDVSQKEGNLEDEHGSLKNVSFRRRGSNLRSRKEDTSLVGELSPLGHSTVGDLSRIYGEEQNRMERFEEVCQLKEFENNGAQIDCTVEDHTDMEVSLAPLDLFAEVVSSTPQPRRKASRERERCGRERIRKGKVESANIAPLKKPWENSKPRTRSKSRERGNVRQTAASKDKMDISVCSNDAYDFLAEESVHITPFRQGKGPEESEAAESQNSSISNRSSDEMESEEDSIYVPNIKKTKIKPRLDGEEQTIAHLRPRSKRGSHKIQQQIHGGKENENVHPAPKSGIAASKTKTNKRSVGLKKTKNAPTDTRSVFVKDVPDTENGMQIDEVQTVLSPRVMESTRIAEVYSPHNVQNAPEVTPSILLKQDLLLMDQTLGGTLTPRFGLRELTNFSVSSAAIQSRKISCPLFAVEDSDKITVDSRKRRCTVTVNYKEPKLSGKLRRGDRFTDTEFLRSPIFKQADTKRKSFKRLSMNRYNEAFVGCR